MKYVGQSFPGLKNIRLVSGKGVFVDDIQLPGMAYMAVLRSPHAHARILGINTRWAETLPGVVYVMTGRDVEASMNPIPPTFETVFEAKTEGLSPEGLRWFALCPERVRYVGEAVAAVVAEDRYTAYQAMALIEVDYEILPAITDPEEALKPDAPLVEPAMGNNLRTGRDLRHGDVEQAFAEADGTVSGTVRLNRVTGAAIEPRGYVASYDPYSDQLQFWGSIQSPYPLRHYLARTLGVPENSIRVIQPEVGGAFGLKLPTFQEEPLVAYLARRLRRPVKWIEDRRENFQVGGHNRDTRIHYEAAFKADGTITGLRAKVIADVGAPTAHAGWRASYNTWYCLPGMYKIPNLHLQLRAVMTNKCPWNPYRGYGKDAACFLMERVMDHVARATGVDRTLVRFKHFIQPSEFPYPQPSGAVLDSGNYSEALKRLLELADYDNFPKWQETERKKGRYIGLGISMELTPEGASVAGSLMASGYDGATVRVTPMGEVTVLTGITSPGTGNETAIAQIVADALGCTMERVRVVQGDTEVGPWGLGNYSSRSTMIGGSAARMAALAVREKIFAVAGKMLEVSPEDLDSGGDRVYVKGVPDRFVQIEDVATQVYRHAFGKFAADIEPALEATRHFRIGNVYHQPESQGRYNPYPAWPNGAAACVVEVDPETGFVKILRYYLVHDAGKIVNPLLAGANLHGSVAQGIGGAMYEQIVYSDSGQLLTTTFMDYTVPTAVEMPPIELEHQETPSPFTPLGTKGVGESGVGGTLNALASAIEDALPHLDVHLMQLPLTPFEIWQAIQQARRATASP